MFFFYTLSTILSFLPYKNSFIVLKLKRIKINIFCAIKDIGHHARLKEKEHIFRYRAWLEGNFFRCVGARADVRALMTQKSCAIGMRSAILRNHLKNFLSHVYWTIDLCSSLYIINLPHSYVQRYETPP